MITTSTTDQIIRSLAASKPAFDRLALAAQQITKSFNAVCEAWYQQAEIAYCIHHGGRLPGGLSNARLIKKRRVKVLDWYGQYLFGPTIAKTARVQKNRISSQLLPSHGP